MPEANLTLRPVLPGDVDTLAALARSTFYDTFAHTCSAEDMQDFLDAYFKESLLLEEINLPGNHYYFAEINKRAVGYLQFMEDYSGFELIKKWKALELKRIYVAKEYQGRGVAQVLMQKVLGHAAADQYEVVWLGVWEHNTRARKFYTRYGFENSGHTHDFPIGNTPQTDQWFWKFL